MQKSSKSLVSILFIIIILAIGYFGTYSQWQKLGEARAGFDVSKQANDKLKKAQADSNAFISKYENNRAEAELANRALPMGHPDIPTILDSFSRLVADSGMGLGQMNIGEKQRGSATEAPVPNSVESLDVDMEVFGTYEAFNDLLLRVQRNLRLIDLVALNIGGGQEETTTQSNNLTFSLKFRTYYQP